MELIQFLNQDVEVIRKAGRRNLTLNMHPDKILVVRTNIRTSHKQIFDFLVSKQKWIEKNIFKFKALNEQFKMPTFKAGDFYPFLGEFKYLQFSSTRLKRIFFKFEDGFLVCYLPENLALSEIKPDILSVILKNKYKTEAEIYLKKRVLYWSELTGLVPVCLNFRANKSRWGSCSSSQNITLNWKLICQSAMLIDYVIIHELCHLQHFNHSEKFWKLVESILPSYETIRDVLNQQERLGRFLI